jgi:hypothetical protein
MSGLTIINPSWIPELCQDCSLLHWLPPLTQPQPFYDLEQDLIKCYVPSVYGAHRWELPPIVQPLQLCCNRMIEESGKNKTEILTGYRKEDEIYRSVWRELTH